MCDNACCGVTRTIPAQHRLLEHHDAAHALARSLNEAHHVQFRREAQPTGQIDGVRPRPQRAHVHGRHAPAGQVEQLELGRSQRRQREVNDQPASEHGIRAQRLQLQSR